MKNCLIIIAYNQSQYIKECLDSIKVQERYIERIEWFDDGSDDNSMEVLKNELKENESISKKITIHQNGNNLGIYKNMHRTFQEWNCDFIHYLACDDWFENKEYFKEFNEFCEKIENIEEKPIMITTNHYYQRNNEIKIIEYKEEDRNLTGILRGNFSSRNLGISNILYKKIGKYKLKLGIWADKIFEIELYLKAEKIYHLEKAYNCYRAGVGYSSKYDEKKMARSAYMTDAYILKKFKEKINNKDQIFLKYTIAKNRFIVEKNIKNLIVFLYRYIENIGNKIEYLDPIYIVIHYYRKLNEFNRS